CNAGRQENVLAGSRRQQSVEFQCGVNPREIVRTSRLLSHEIGVFPQPNKAIVGRNAFAHEAGIHQHGMLQNGLTYEIISPETVGAGGASSVLGKHSGRHALGRTIEVIDLSVQSVTPGRDSLGRVVLQVRIDGKSLSGHGASTDIVEAGARALVHALNKADHADGLETMALSSSYYWGV